MKKSKIFILIFTILLALPAPSRAATLRLEAQMSGQTTSLFGSIRSFLGIRRQTYKPKPGTTFTVAATGYSSSPYQTDSTPCITSSGTRVRRGTVASNFLPLGTLLQIGDEIFIVEDRMNPRYHKSIDIYFPHTSEALDFGKKELTLTIIGYGTPGQELSPTTAGGSKQDISIANRLRGRWYYLRRVTSSYLGLRAYDINYYDVDCFKENQRIKN